MPVLDTDSIFQQADLHAIVQRVLAALGGATRYRETIADNLSKAGWSLGCVSAADSRGRTIWIADAHRDDGKRFVVRADDSLTAFLEVEAAISSAEWLAEAPRLVRAQH